MKNLSKVFDNLKWFTRDNCAFVDAYIQNKSSFISLMCLKERGFCIKPLIELKRRVESRLLYRCNMIFNKTCEFIIGIAIDRYFSSTDIIKFMGEYVYARKTLRTLWLNDLSVMNSSLDKLWFSLTRAKEARYFKFKKLPVSGVGHPSSHRFTRKIAHNSMNI